MKVAGMELTFDLSAREREKVQSALGEIARRQRDGNLFDLSKPVWRLLAVLFLGFIAVRWLVDFLPAFFGGEIDVLRPGEMLNFLLGPFAIWILADNIRYLAGDIVRPMRAERIWRKGLHWGEHHLAVTPEGLSLRLADYESEYRWPAFTGLHKTKDMLLLTVTPWSAVAVPRRAFQSPAEESAFCDFVDARIGVAT